ncbi:hypothetical protein GCM10027578_00730 [Spirosoma luteolum]
MWNATHFPAAMRSLNTSTRAKAIEIANLMLAQGHVDKQYIVMTSVLEARRWARQLQSRPAEPVMSAPTFA